MKTFYKNLKVIFCLISFILLIGNSFSQSWNALGAGTSGQINATIVFNGKLIAAGNFMTAGTDTLCRRIAQWDGTTWTHLGTGMDSTIYAIAIYNNQLIAAGSFINAGGVTCNRIAAWNGTTWSSLGLGTNGDVLCLAVYANYLRAGGRFTTAGGITATRLARWNGAWSAMTFAAPNNDVYCFATFGANLAVGGRFTTVNGLTVNRICTYNGTNFTALGTGIDTGAVFAAISYSGSLYVGGNFYSVGGVAVHQIARWSGTNWNTISSGTDGAVRSFALNGTGLAVGGSFLHAGGILVNNIANWDGSTFSAYGNGVTGGTTSVNGIAIWSNVLVAGGVLTTAGTAPNVAANNIAGYGSVPISPTLTYPPNASTGIILTTPLLWTTVPNTTTYGVEVSGNPNFTTFKIDTVGLAAPGDTVHSGILANDSTYFWRANASNGLGTSGFSNIFFFTTGLVGVINNHEVPLAFRLYQNYPNPFNPTTKIRFDLPEIKNQKNVSLVIYDATGRVVINLTQPYAAGKWEINFDASNLSSGVYFCKITAGSFNAVNKMMLLK